MFDYLPEWAVWVLAVLPLFLLIFGPLISRVFWPNVWERAYSLGFEDGLAGKPHHTRHFESQTANNGYSSGIDDARGYLSRQNQKRLQLLDAEKLRELDSDGR